MMIKLSLRPLAQVKFKSGHCSGSTYRLCQLVAVDSHRPLSPPRHAAASHFLLPAALLSATVRVHNSLSLSFSPSLPLCLCLSLFFPLSHTSFIVAAWNLVVNLLLAAYRPTSMCIHVQVYVNIYRVFTYS